MKRMKRILSVILCLALVLSVAGCSGGDDYTPEYGQPLTLAENLSWKKEYKDAVSPDTRDLISDYLVKMVSAYNSVDPRREQDRYFAYGAYFYTNDFMENAEPAISPVAYKAVAGEELSDKEQLFWDMINMLYEIPVKYTRIERDATSGGRGENSVNEPDSARSGAESRREENSADSGENSSEDTDRSSDDGDAAKPRDSRSESEADGGNVSEGRDSRSSGSRDGETSQTRETVHIDRGLWEELFDLYVEIFTTLYDRPFVKP